MPLTETILLDPATDATLAAARLACSPRSTPGLVPWSSHAIHAAVLAMWAGVFAAAFGFSNIYAWSAGLVYVAYDAALLAFVFVRTLPLLAPAPRGAALVQGETLGVIVAAHNEAMVLPRTIETLLAQADAPQVILIADDGSTDATAAVLHAAFGLVPPALGEVAGAGPVRWLRLPHGGKARALNAALTRLDTELVVTVDADTLLRPGAISAVRRAFAADPRLVATTGVLIPLCAKTASGRVLEWFQTYEYIRNFLSRYAWAGLDCLLLISGAFGGFRRSALLAVGGFDPDGLVEDYELIHRLKRHSALGGLRWTTRVLGDAQAWTEAPSSLPAFVRQRRRWFGGFLQTQFWYREMVGARRYGALGLAMLPIKAIDAVQPFYGLTALAILLAAAFGEQSLVAPIFGIIGAKLALDLAFHGWSVMLHRRWLGDTTGATMLGALVAGALEPFTFQILRHVSAAWGWGLFLAGRQTWVGQRRQDALRAAP